MSDKAWRIIYFTLIMTVLALLLLSITIAANGLIKGS